MGDIGKPRREIELEPVERPARRRRQVTAPTPAPAPVPQPEPVPA